MPHKRNPITAERLAGLARILRGNLVAGLEDVALWHERDISHSSVERVILPDSSLLAYYVLRSADRLVAGLQVCPGADAGQPLVQPRPRLLPARPAGPRGRGPEPRRRLPHRAGGRHAGLGRGRLVPVAPGEGRAGHASRRTRWTRPSRSSGPCATSARSSTRWMRSRRRTPRGLMDGPGLPLVYRGKVRDLYDAGDGRLLMVASDRLSAFDVVMAEPVPDKGRVLTAMSAFWFELLGDLARQPPRLDRAGRPPGRRPGSRAGRADHARAPLRDAAGGVHRAGLPGRLGWQEYREAGTVCGLPLPAGLREADQLPAPIFTPSTKAAVGIHDENISFDDVVERIGGRRWPRPPATSPSPSTSGPRRTPRHGASSSPTPSWSSGCSTAAWSWPTRSSPPTRPASGRATAGSRGAHHRSYDKQPVRDELAASGWDKRPPPPALSPATVVARPGPATSRATNASRGARSTTGRAAPAHDHGCGGGACHDGGRAALRARRGPPPPRDRRPAGCDHRALAADARLRHGARRHRREGHPLHGRGRGRGRRPPPGRGALPALPDQPRHRGRDDHHRAGTATVG